MKVMYATYENIATTCVLYAERKFITRYARGGGGKFFPSKLRELRVEKSRWLSSTANAGNVG